MRVTTGAVIGLILASLGGCSEQVRGPTPLESELARNAMPESIAARLQTRRNAFSSCHDIYGPNLSGVLVLRFRIRADGTPTLPHVFEDIGQSSQFDRCVVDTINRLTFGPLPPRTFADVTYPLVFRDLSRAPASVTTTKGGASPSPEPRLPE